MSPWRQQTAAHPKNMSDLWNIHNSLLTITWHIFKVECHLVSYYNVSYYNKLTKKYYLRMIFVTFSIFLEHSSNNHTESWIIKQYQTCNFHYIILTYSTLLWLHSIPISHPPSHSYGDYGYTHTDSCRHLKWYTMMTARVTKYLLTLQSHHITSCGS